MKQFKQYINSVIQDPFLTKTVSQVTTILLPTLHTTEGIYRSALPSYVLNSIPDHKMILAGLSDKIEISHNVKDLVISQKLIRESSHIVFPFVSYALSPIIDNIRATKPNMRFSYYIDSNYYLMPESYPYSKQYKLSKILEIIEGNIKAVDQVIVTNKTLKDYIADKLKERHPDVKFNTNIIYQPLFILPQLLKTDYENSKKADRTKVLIIGDQYQFSDINFLKGILKEYKSKNTDKCEIHIIGFDGIKGNKNYLSDIDYQYHKRVPYFQYFELIKHIAPDVLLVPANKNTFNSSSKNYIKYIEAAYLNIPVIAPNIEPYSELITTNRNGFLCDAKEDYLMHLEFMFTAPEKFDAVLGHAYAMAVDYDISIESNIDILKNIYFTQNAKSKAQ